jgi:hypothetical protein
LCLPVMFDQALDPLCGAAPFSEASESLAEPHSLSDRLQSHHNFAKRFGNPLACKVHPQRNAEKLPRGDWPIPSVQSAKRDAYRIAETNGYPRRFGMIRKRNTFTIPGPKQITSRSASGFATLVSTPELFPSEVPAVAEKSNCEAIGVFPCNRQTTRLRGNRFYRRPERSHCFGLSLFRQSSLKQKCATSMRSNALLRQLS